MKEQLRKADLPGLVIIAGALLAYSVRGIWTVYQTGAVIAGVLLVIVSLALRLDEIRAGMGRRSTRFGMNSATSVVLLLGILGLVNYLGAQHLKRIDLTTEKVYSLSEQSVQVAGQVPEDLKIKAFYSGGDDPATRDLLELFTDENKKISFEFIDPDKQPLLAKQYDVSVYGDSGAGLARAGTLVLEMADKKERIEKQTDAVQEEDVTNALMKIVKGEKKTIYFTEGHGEKSLTGTEGAGYSLARTALEKENYTVKTVNLVRDGKVPEDASVLVMPGPTSEPFQNELDLLDAYLKSGGSILLLLDPPPAASLADFTKKWSIDVGNNIVIDASGVGRMLGINSPAVPLVTSYSDHKITERFGLMTFFPLVRSVLPAKPAVPGIDVQTIISSNEQSWGETDIKSSQAKLDDKVDIKGPVSLAVAATQDQGDMKKSRLVVFGDSDFGMNAYFEQQGDGNLLMNALTWLAQDENFIAIRPKTPGDRQLSMTESAGRMIFHLFVWIMPLSILAGGVFVWMNRRK